MPLTIAYAPFNPLASYDPPANRMRKYYGAGTTVNATSYGLLPQSFTFPLDQQTVARFVKHGTFFNVYDNANTGKVVCLAAQINIQDPSGEYAWQWSKEFPGGGLTLYETGLTVSIDSDEVLLWGDATNPSLGGVWTVEAQADLYNADSSNHGISGLFQIMYEPWSKSAGKVGTYP